MSLADHVDSICKSRNYVKLEKLSVLALTFNVNAKIEEFDKIKKILLFENHNCKNHRADLIIIGLQEVVELSPTNVVGGAVLGSATETLDTWMSMFIDTVNDNIHDKNHDKFGLPEYEIFEREQMVGTAAILLVLSSKIHLLKNVQAAVVPRGMGNVLGNKGAVCIRLEIQNTSICFVTCHLTAHREQVSKRNDDYFAIITAKIFTEYELAPSKPPSDPKMATLMKDIHRIRSKLPAGVSSKIPNLAEEMHSMTTYAPDDHDIVIWLGDLNYRIREGETLDDVYNMIYDNATDALSAIDQLVIEMKAGNAFEGFREGKLDFSPTYQYVPGCDTYDRREDKKKRCPAWCDRILWRVGKGTERLKSTLMNFRTDGNILLDTMKLPYPSAIQYLDPVAIQTISQELFIKKKKVLSILEKGAQRENFSELSIDEIRTIIREFYERANIEKVELCGFERCESNLSDHKPVKALFSLDIKSVDFAERERGLIDGLNSYLKSTDIWRGNDDKSASEYLIRPDLFELESASMLRYDLSGKDKKPPFSLTVRLPGNAIPMQKALLTGTYVPISVSPATLVLTPSTVKLLNTITLINKETTGDIDIVVYESSVPSWVSVNPTCGRLRPKEPFHMVLSFDTAAYNEMMQETVNSASSSASPFLSTSSASSSNVLRGLGGSSASISSVLASTLSVGTSTGTNNQGVGKEFQPKLLRGSKSTANVEGLLVIQYMAAGKSVSPSVDTKGEVTLADGTKESVLLQIDKLIIPIAYEVYHEV